MAKLYYWLEKSGVYHTTLHCESLASTLDYNDLAFLDVIDSGNLRQARGERIDHAGDDEISYQRRPCKRCVKMF